MRRFLLCTACLIGGLVIGAGLRFTRHYQVGYLRGQADATAAMQREAVRQGHGRWERAGDGIAFAWIPVRDAYAPGTLTMIPGIE